MNTTMLLLLLMMMVPIFVPLIFIPYWTRKTESFGVSIPEEIFHEVSIKKKRKSYAWTTGLLALATIIIFSLFANGHDEDFIATLFTILIFVYLFGSFIVYLIFHRQMKELKRQNPSWVAKPQQVLVDMGFRNRKLTLSNGWFVIPFIFSIATIVITLVNFQQIPDRYPMQYNFSGEVTTWANKSYRSVLLMPIMEMYMTMLFLFINIVISKAKQQVSAENPEVSIQQNVTFRRRWSLFTLIAGTGIVMLLSLHQFSLIYSINHQFLMIAPLVYVIGVCGATILLSITTGQGGSRVTIKGSGPSSTVINRDDDQYWKLGMFYFNKNDPAIFLEKRFGIGWTNNWAHPLSWIFIVVIILIVAILPKVLG
ncbi:DUF1648 domain-containing protein [Neobacillus jeddahensis]|uniref:DUF1648 domain-containing protein n=1 Tax=Neobacillus jeddahensis TaxID=1461580 RepID=UPI00058DC924|nr:DUF5808 domain-containing protein [Neobacillus jeddahensis]